MADPDRRLHIDIVEKAGDWSAFDIDAMAAQIEKAVSSRLPAVDGVVVLALADDATVRDLNRRFRGQDKSTNVLSFPSGEEPGRDAHLGDVILARETLQHEARLEGKPDGDHLAHLAIHGILHLLGYDHDSDKQAQLMERLETSILGDMGIADPYRDTVTADGQALGGADA